MQCGMEASAYVVVVSFNGSPGCFDSSHQVLQIVWSGISHPSLDNTPHIPYEVMVKLINHSITMVVGAAFGTFGIVDRS